MAEKRRDKLKTRLDKRIREVPENVISRSRSSRSLSSDAYANRHRELIDEEELHSTNLEEVDEWTCLRILQKGYNRNKKALDTSDEKIIFIKTLKEFFENEMKYYLDDKQIYEKGDWNDAMEGKWAVTSARNFVFIYDEIDTILQEDEKHIIEDIAKEDVERLRASLIIFEPRVKKSLEQRKSKGDRIDKLYKIHSGESNTEPSNDPAFKVGKIIGYLMVIGLVIGVGTCIINSGSDYSGSSSSKSTFEKATGITKEEYRRRSNNY